MKKYNYITSACFMLLGIYVFIEASGYKQKGIGQQNPALWPEVIATIMIICSIGLIIETVLKKEDKKTKEAAALAEGLDETEEMIRERLEEVSSGDLFAELSGGEEEEISWTTPGMKRVYAGMAMVVGFLVIMKELKPEKYNLGCDLYERMAVLKEHPVHPENAEILSKLKL